MHAQTRNTMHARTRITHAKACARINTRSRTHARTHKHLYGHRARPKRRQACFRVVSDIPSCFAASGCTCTRNCTHAPTRAHACARTHTTHAINHHPRASEAATCHAPRPLRCLATHAPPLSSQRNPGSPPPPPKTTTAAVSMYSIACPLARACMCPHSTILT